MSKLIGLAFTSPGIAVLAVDRDRYRVFFHDQSTAADFRLFLQQKDDRKPVVFVKAVRDLAELQPIGAGVVESFVLFDDPNTMIHIKGITIPDITGDALAGWSKVTVSPDDFNAMLDNGVNDTFEVTEQALSASGNLVKGITFRELVAAVETSYADLNKDSSEFVVLACKYIMKLINKKSWVSMARKPALTAGLSAKVLAELERAIETDKASDELWRAFYDYSTNGTELQKVLTGYAINREDLEFIVTKLNATPGQQLEFTAVPGSARKKRTKAS